MEKKVALYEALFAFDGTLADDEIKALVEKFTTLVKDNATDVTVNEWGKRRLAYPIQYKNDGYYVLYTFNAEASFPAELTRVARITENVFRALVTRSNGANVSAPAVVEETVVEEEVASDAPVAEEAN